MPTALESADCGHGPPIASRRRRTAQPQRRVADHAGRNGLAVALNRHASRLSSFAVEVDEVGGVGVPGVVDDFPMRPHMRDGGSVLFADDALDAPADLIQLVARVTTAHSLRHGTHTPATGQCGNRPGRGLQGVIAIRQRLACQLARFGRRANAVPGWPDD